MFFTVTVWVLLPPTASLPKFTMVADSESVRDGATPVPLSAIASEEFDALLLNVRLPVTLAAAVGPNATVTFLVCPGANVSGVVSPLRLNPVLIVVSLLIVKLCPPVFFSWMVCEFVVPSTTEPKLTLAGVAVNDPKLGVPRLKASNSVAAAAGATIAPEKFAVSTARQA